MSEQIKAGAPVGNQNAKKTTYHKGDLAEYTGETRDIAGGKFHVLKILEGHREGKEELTQRGPDGSDPYVDQSQADWKKQQEEFARLHATEAVTEGDLVTASDAIRGRAQAFAPEAQWKQGEEVTFTFMPKGTHTINAGFRGKTINLTVQVDKATTNAVQASLDKQRTLKPKQKPYGCVEHREQEASVIAHGFRWSDDEGVLIAAEPTALGERNVNGKIHWSWSPSFFTDAEYAKAKEAGGVWTFPNGVRGSSSNPARVTGVAFCVGTLTNNPAFHEMPPVKASEGAEAEAVTDGAPAGNQNAAGAQRHAQDIADAEKNADHHEERAEMHSHAFDNMEDSDKRLAHAKAERHHTRAAENYRKTAEHFKSDKTLHAEEALDKAERHAGEAEDTESEHSLKATDATETDTVQATVAKKPTTAAILARLDDKRCSTDAVLASVRKRQLGIEDKVTASGTSEGVKKSWEKRKQNANSMTESAIVAGNKSLQSRNISVKLHGEAAKEHQKASDAHREIADDSNDPHEAEHHLQKADWHELMAHRHGLVNKESVNEEHGIIAHDNMAKHYRGDLYREKNNATDSTPTEAVMAPVAKPTADEILSRIQAATK